LDTNEPGSPATYRGTVRLDRSGSFGYTVRVVPHHALLASSAEMGLVATAG
jgi:glycogen phosphorylase